MDDLIELRFTGTLAPENQITARTLGHSLTNIQRAVDKLIIIERRGSLRKYSAISHNDYDLADLIVQEFELGSIKIPLINTARVAIASKLRGIMEEAYRIAASQEAINEVSALHHQVDNARQRAHNVDVRNPTVNPLTQERLIEGGEIAEREYAKAAILADINNLMAPLRSQGTPPDDTIEILLRDDDLSKNYVFDKHKSKRFNKIVRQKKLGPEAIYIGILDGLESTKIPGFPFSGKFISDLTKEEVRLWVKDEETALSLNPHNLTKAPFAFWGAPIMTYGAFDAIRGDIVFLDFVR